jgi:antitoxin MazE
MATGIAYASQTRLEEYPGMRRDLTRIGNSRGIRIPKPLIAQYGLGEVVELRVTPAGLVNGPHHAPSHGWRQAFAATRPSSARFRPSLHRPGRSTARSGNDDLSNILGNYSPLVPLSGFFLASERT